MYLFDLYMDLFEYYISTLLEYAKSSGKFYLDGGYPFRKNKIKAVYLI